MSPASRAGPLGGRDRNTHAVGGQAAARAVAAWLQGEWSRCVAQAGVSEPHGAVSGSQGGLVAEGGRRCYVQWGRRAGSAKAAGTGGEEHAGAA